MLQLKFNASADYHVAAPATVENGRVLIVENSAADSGYSLIVGINDNWVYLPLQVYADKMNIPIVTSDTATALADLAAGEIRFRRSVTGDFLYVDHNNAGTVESAKLSELGLA